MRETATSPVPSGKVSAWLYVVYAMIFLMVIIGGITRLTGSGLSMVEWRPLFGALPPLNEPEWVRVFEQYKLFPQYQRVNQWMTLADFKAIFFWEYLHRLFGRLIGVVFFVPWVAFLVRGELKGQWGWRSFIAFLLGGAQGLLGWFMVKSGLVDRPDVSHFRLAAHLALALFVAHYVLWLILDLRSARATAPRPAAQQLPPLAWGWGFVGLLCLQITYGAFMAGTRAGFISSTWPDINGQWIPAEMGALGGGLIDWTENLFSIHFIHRTLGYGVFLAALALWAAVERRGSPPQIKMAARFVAGVASMQVVLGVLTVLLHVPVWLGVTHQAVGFALLSASVFYLHQRRGAQA